MALAGALLGGCATGGSGAAAPGPDRPTAGPAEALDDAAAQARGVLLLLSDRRTWEPSAVALALEGDAATRRQLALTLGRIGDPRGATALEGLLADPDPEVRRTAVFALGLLGARESAPAVLPLLVGDDRELGIRAVEALARMGARLEAVVEQLLGGPADELLPRLAPALFRFDDPAVVTWAAQGLEEPDPETRALSAWALARPARPEGLELLRSLLADDDARIRSWSARALGQVGDRTDLDRLAPLLGDPDPGPIVQALRAARRLVDEGEAAPPAAWVPVLVELIGHPDAGVRVTALEVAGGWRGEPALADALARVATAGEPRERQLAFLSLAESGEPRAAGLLRAVRTDADPALRETAARGAGFLRVFEVLEELAADPAPRVRVTALGLLVLARPETKRERLEAALVDVDPAVRATALDLLAEDPVLPVDALVEGYGLRWRDRLPEPRLAGIRALVARAHAAGQEWEPIVDELRRLAHDAELAVRREAVRSLDAMGEPAPAIGPGAGRRTAEVYVDIARRTAARRLVEVETERGTFRVRLDCPAAPLTCLAFLQLVGQGFYDGLTFHRVVPEFVVQGGDPRGDGWGGPGTTLRDEIGPERFVRGAVGLALSGPDTGGSQFFVALERQPHLDGASPYLGEVVAGLEVLDLLLQGDRIVRISEIPPG